MRSLLTLAACCLFVTFSSAQPRTVADLKRCSPEELHALYLAGTVGDLPQGDLPGQVLHFNDRHFAKARVRMSNLFWKGKWFGSDTYFENLWLGGHRFLGSHHAHGTSWVDGKPALILEYPRRAPMFGNMHDELREIAPGLFLGVIFMKEPCPYHRGYFAIEVPGCCR